MKPKHDTSITVLTRKEFEDAVSAKYRTIVVQGEFAYTLRKELNKPTTGKKAYRNPDKMQRKREFSR